MGKMRQAAAAGRGERRVHVALHAATAAPLEGSYPGACSWQLQPVQMMMADLATHGHGDLSTLLCRRRRDSRRGSATAAAALKRMNPTATVGLEQDPVPPPFGLAETTAATISATHHGDRQLAPAVQPPYADDLSSWFGTHALRNEESSSAC
jgi:hypothetical protein